MLPKEVLFQVQKPYQSSPPPPPNIRNTSIFLHFAQTLSRHI